MKKYLVIRQYKNLSPDFVAMFDTWEEADNFAKLYKTGDPSRNYWVYEQSK